MSLFKRFLAWAFGRQYVLVVFDDKTAVKHAYQLGNSWWVNAYGDPHERPYAPWVRTELLPGGKVVHSFRWWGSVNSWRPITKNMLKFSKEKT